ncbi:hypothetical protein [Burkholderia sp. JKS000303]|uniref:hypothetical protein n=1 Tax=Burkholderia sp. JKS000303 TaxID=1938747 RepID=UPI000C019708|nr:hypothetical protein [Burkholderia sp. JKS000303]PFH26661.1 hypothetical protein BX604_0357 [Burkholderia sp. JKS000303]
MTIVVLWYSKKHDKLLCAADTRISRGDSVSTDSGPKILPISVVCHEETETVGVPTIARRVTYGFAYSGATLGAISTYSLANVFTQSLSAGKGQARAVSVEAVAQLFAKVANHYFTDVAMRLGSNSDFNAAYFELMVFGHCAVSDELKAYKIKPVRRADLFEMTCENLVIFERFISIMGSGAEDFATVYIELSEARQVLVSPVSAMKELLKREQRADVGGGIQLGMSMKPGFRIVPILEGIANPDDVKVTFVGWDSAQLGDVDGYQIGYFGMTFDD